MEKLIEQLNKEIEILLTTLEALHIECRTIQAPVMVKRSAELHCETARNSILDARHSVGIVENLCNHEYPTAKGADVVNITCTWEHPCGQVETCSRCKRRASFHDSKR